MFEVERNIQPDETKNVAGKQMVTWADVVKGEIKQNDVNKPAESKINIKEGAQK